ncbi:MAG: hypothetical protein JRJ87_12250 [Deltaproteobacteria bacterium]|nr:hypothetical protein [Deltaproteobacteria bacterium]
MTPDIENDQVDELFGQLKSLARHDLDELRTQRIRQRSHRILARHRRSARRLRTATSRIYSRYLEPALVCGFCGLILLWAFDKARYLLL